MLLNDLHISADGKDGGLLCLVAGLGLLHSDPGIYRTARCVFRSPGISDAQQYPGEGECREGSSGSVRGTGTDPKQRLSS